jgi:hypothetical protein
VNIIRKTAALMGALMISACGAIEDNAWTNGVSRNEALELRSFIATHKGAHEFYSYGRQEDGGIIVSTDAGIWVAYRLGRGWKLVEAVAVS